MYNINYKLKDYTDEDYEFVYEAKKIAYRKYVEENFKEWNETKQREIFEAFICAYGKDIKIIMDEVKKIGFYHGEMLENGGFEIGNICIIPEYQGKGIGTRLLKNILEEHRDKDIYLRYFKQNPVVKLYERLGFEIIEEMPYHFKMVLRAKENIKEGE